jgi:hypothetical protein
MSRRHCDDEKEHQLKARGAKTSKNPVVSDAKSNKAKLDFAPYLLLLGDFVADAAVAAAAFLIGFVSLCSSCTSSSPWCVLVWVGCSPHRRRRDRFVVGAVGFGFFWLAW